MTFDLKSVKVIFLNLPRDHYVLVFKSYKHASFKIFQKKSKAGPKMILDEPLTPYLLYLLKSHDIV